jgi:hypothetical protein
MKTRMDAKNFHGRLDTTTIDLQMGSTGTDVSASGAWSESFVKWLGTPWVMNLLAPVGMPLAIAASPATAVPDYWFLERRRRGAATTTGILEDVIGRPISRLEALRIAARILEEAERERSEIAAWEARRGIQWEAEE